jgi:AraC family transcriptional regulator
MLVNESGWMVNANASAPKWVLHAPHSHIELLDAGDLKVIYSRSPYVHLAEHEHAETIVTISFVRAPFQMKLAADGVWRERFLRNTVCIRPAGRVAHIRCDESVEMVVFKFSETYLAHIAREFAKVETIEIGEHYGVRDSFMQQIGMALRAEFRAGARPTRLYAESLANILAVHLLRRYNRRAKNQTHAARGSLNALRGSRLRRVTDYINDNLHESLSLTELAQIVSMSSFHFARSFKQATGQTPHQFVTAKRIERAKHLLAESDLPIAEISFRVGFQSQSHFTNLFRKLTATTPKAYRISVKDSLAHKLL